MTEQQNGGTQRFWSKTIQGTFAFLLLAAVPALALPVLGADVFSLKTTNEQAAASPLTFDAPATTLLKMKAAQEASSHRRASADELALAKWKNTSFDLLTALILAVDGSSSSSSGSSLDVVLISLIDTELQAILTLLTDLIAYIVTGHFSGPF